MIRTPTFIVDLPAVEQNLAVLEQVSREAECKILLAQKAFSCYPLYPRLARSLAGTTASGLYEARLGKEHFGKETHVYSPAYREDEFEELLGYADHIVFNSPAQLSTFGARAKALGKQIGLRINPECSTQQGHAQYDPCAPGSRFGTTRENFDFSIADTLDGLHMHTLCEQNSDDLEKTTDALEQKFGDVLSRVTWLNLGGGHHITRADYDRNRLIRLIRRLKDKYDLEIYLEPGEAVVLNAGELEASVLDVMHNGVDIAILDASAACHMPDVLEMPYRPPVQNSGEPGEKPYTYRLAGNTCLAGDVIGDYSFDRPLAIGDRVRFLDMALYTMVKTNTFNGTPLPSIAVRESDGSERILKRFGYDDFRTRLG